MSTGSWDPNIEQKSKELVINKDTLLKFIDLSKNEQLDSLDQLIGSEDQQLHAGLMLQSRDSWEKAAEHCDNEELLHLIRFFTIAEMQLAGWRGDDNSPVIWITKVLRKRGQKLDKDFLLWIKANSNNLFLPHGSLL